MGSVAKHIQSLRGWEGERAVPEVVYKHATELRKTLSNVSRGTSELPRLIQMFSFGTMHHQTQICGNGLLKYFLRAKSACKKDSGMQFEIKNVPAWLQYGSNFGPT